MAVVPRQVKILGKTYTIHLTHGKPLGKDDIGQHDSGEQTIHLKDGLKLEKEQSTLLHECLHGISDGAGIALTEQQVDALETGLIAFIWDNPKVISYLRRREDG